MKAGPRVLLYEVAGLPGQALDASLATRGLSVQRCDLAPSPVCEPLAKPAIALLVANNPAGHGRLQDAATLLERLVRENVTTLVIGGDALRSVGGPQVAWLAPDISIEELVGRLETLSHYVPLVQRFERELSHMQRLGEQLNRYFSEIDQEMRLAGRLQRDLLPAALPALPDFAFDVIYRPASWVSGDMYDVFRIDEHHIGLFIADAMGHGVAAGLVTMSLRQALNAKRISGCTYQIVSPPEALAGLHASLLRQRLPNCQFVTAVYAVLDTRTAELRVARAGHPYPLLCTADGQVRQICAAGGLLGLPDIEPDYDEATVQLAPGDKLLLFSDGLEEDFLTKRTAQSERPDVSPCLREWARLPLPAAITAIRAHLDGKAGSLHPADDVTLVAVEAAVIGAGTADSLALDFFAAEPRLVQPFAAEPSTAGSLALEGLPAPPPPFETPAGPPN